MLASLRPIVAAAFLCLSASALAAPDPDVTNGLLGVLDTPTTQPPRQVPTPRGLQGRPPWKITCFDYPGYRVKTLSGDDEGDSLISAQVLAPGARPPICGPQDDPGEKMISKTWLYFEGAKGGFLVLISPEGYLIQIYDAIGGKQVYKDTANYTEIRSFDVAGDTATITYTRHEDGQCSVLTGGGACWQHFVREAKLPAEFATLEAAKKACTTEFQRQSPGPRVPPESFSILTYLAKVTVDRNGHSTTLSRSNLGCTFPG